MDNSEQLNKSEELASTSYSRNSEQVEHSNKEPEGTMEIESKEQTTNEIRFVEESVAEVILPTQTEDTVPLDNSEIPRTPVNLSEAIPGPSTSRTSQTETTSSSVATETTAASTSDASPMRPRIIRVIAHQSYSGGVEDGRINRRYVELKYELIKKKVDFLRLKRERLMEEFDLRMKLLRTQLTFEEKKLLIFRKKYRR